MAGPVCLAPDGVWLAAVSPRRWWALTPPFHPYLRRLRREARRSAVSFLCHFPSAFAAWVAPASCPAVSGLSSSPKPAVTRPASRIVAASVPNRPPRAGTSGTPGHVIMPPRVQDELAADEALEARAAEQRLELLLERAVERRDRAHSSRNTPVTRPRICTCVRVDRLERVVLRLQAHASASRGRSASPSPRPPTRRRRRARRRSRRSARPARAAPRRCRRRGCRRSIIDSPFTRRRKSPRSVSGTARWSSTFCSASSGPPAAICPTSGSLATVAAGASLRSRPTSSSARGLVGSRLQQTGALEVREVCVHGRGRCEADGLADLPHRRRVAVLVDVVDEEVPDLLLSSRQHLRLQGWLVERTCVRQPR